MAGIRRTTRTQGAAPAHLVIKGVDLPWPHEGEGAAHQHQGGEEDERPGPGADDPSVFAQEFLKRIARLKGVRIDRTQYLTAELRRQGVPDPTVRTAIAHGPAAAGISRDVLDRIAQTSISFETKKSSALSFAAGLPGGLAAVGTVPADLTQYYVHAFRIMQKLAYVYGWQSFLEDLDDIDDETLGLLAAFLGVMLGVAGANANLAAFARQVARPAIEKNVANKALMKTAYYPAIKNTLKLVGVKVNRDIFASGVTKAVPVIGGLSAAGMTFAGLRSQSVRLMNHLRDLPLATGGAWPTDDPDCGD